MPRVPGENWKISAVNAGREYLGALYVDGNGFAEAVLTREDAAE